MNKTLSGIIKLIFCILLLKFSEIYYFDILSTLGININPASLLIKEISIVILYIIIFIGVVFLYKDDLKRDLKRFKRNIFPNILMVIVFFIIITLGVKVSEYVSSVIAEAFHEKYIPIKLINIFNKNADIYLLINIIKNILLIPFINSVIYILGVNNLIRGKNKGIFLSGLIAAIVISLNLNGSYLFILFSVIPYFVLYATLAYFYRKNNNNIWYSSITLILYTMLASILLEKIM